MVFEIYPNSSTPPECKLDRFIRKPEALIRKNANYLNKTFSKQISQFI